MLWILKLRLMIPEFDPIIQWQQSVLRQAMQHFLWERYEWSLQQFVGICRDGRKVKNKEYEVKPQRTQRKRYSDKPIDSCNTNALENLNFAKYTLNYLWCKFNHIACSRKFKATNTSCRCSVKSLYVIAGPSAWVCYHLCRVNMSCYSWFIFRGQIV